MYSMQLSYNRIPLSGKGNGHLSFTGDKSMQISLSPGINYHQYTYTLQPKTRIPLHKYFTN